MLPAGSSLTPGISLLPRVRGPIPERNRKSPTRLACGNAPTGSGARELSKDLLMFKRNLTADYADDADDADAEGFGVESSGFHGSRIQKDQAMRRDHQILKFFRGRRH